MTTEGNASQATDTSATSGGSLATNDAGSTTQVETNAAASDPWAALSQPDPMPAAPAAQPAPEPPAAAPAPAQPAQAEAPPAAPDASTGVDEDRFDKITDPKREDFAAIRADRREVVNKLKAAEPIAQRVTEIGGAKVLDFVAPIFQRHETPEKGIEAITGALKSVVAGDPSVKPLLTQAAYQMEPERFQAWALEDLGIRDKWQAFTEWEKAGQPGAGDEPFPQPADGTNLVTLKDGTELDLDDPRDKMTYDLLKEKHEREISDRRQAAEAQKRQEQEQREAAERQQQQAQAEAQTRVTDFAKARDTAFDAAAAQLSFAAGSEAETELAKTMTLAMFQHRISSSEEFLNLSQEGARLSAEGGTLAEERGLAIDRLALTTLAACHKQVMDMFAELHRLRQSAGTGLPPIPNPQSPTPPAPEDTPPNPTGQQPTAIDGIWNFSRR